MLSVSEKKKKDCCGCGLCANICPKDAICMVKDEDGFFYPSVDASLCIECGICVKECSFSKPIATEEYPQKYFVARTIEKDVLKNSASGGIFTPLSDTILERNGVVYGACYDPDYNVIHRKAINKEGRDLFRDSKYIQSECSEVFPEVKDILQSGRAVLFSGTPCQCAALFRFLVRGKTDVSNLYLIDIICHGVGSPLIWKEYLEYTKKKYGIGRIDKIITRNKKVGADYNLSIFSKEKTIVRKDIQDPYIMLFSNNLILRPSCFSCPFKTLGRCTDVTIGDFQKVKKYYPQYFDNKGISVVLVNTQKGSLLFNTIKERIVCEVSDKEKASQVNLYQQIEGMEERNAFFRYYHIHSFRATLNKYTEEGFFNRLRGISKRLVKSLLKT